MNDGNEKEVSVEPKTIGEVFKSVGGWMNGGELGYPSFGSMEALQKFVVKSIRAYLATQPARDTSQPIPTSSIEKISDALNLAMAICDAVPTRAHDLADDESLRHIGELVNCDVTNGKHGYAVIRDAHAAFAEWRAAQPAEGAGQAGQVDWQTRALRAEELLKQFAKDGDDLCKKLDTAERAAAPADHEIREAVNQLRDVAVQFHAHQSLRDRIASVVLPLVRGVTK